MLYQEQQVAYRLCAACTSATSDPPPEVHRNSTKRPTGASRKKLRKEELPGARLCHTDAT